MDNAATGFRAPEPLKLTGNIMENWYSFIEDFTIFITAAEVYGKPKEKVKVASFLNLIGKEAFKLFKAGLIEIPESSEGVSYKAIVKGYENYFKKCQKSTVFNYIKFENRKQLEGEPFDEFLIDIAQMAGYCKFDNLDRRLRDKIIAGLNDPNLKLKLAAKENLSMDDLIAECRQGEKEKRHEKMSQITSKDDQVEFFLRKNVFNGHPSRQPGISLSCEGPSTREYQHNKIRADVGLGSNFEERETRNVFQDKKKTDTGFCSRFEDKEKENAPADDSHPSGSLAQGHPSMPMGGSSQSEDNNITESSKSTESQFCDENNKGKRKRNRKIIERDDVYAWSDDETDIDWIKKRKGKKKKSRYNCNDCGKSYKVLYHLKNHERLHTGEGVHACNVCNKSFSLLINFNRHMTIHNKDK